MGKRYYWLKLNDDFFANKSIKKLRTIAGGDTYTVIYLKLMLKALQTDGKLYFDRVEDTFIEELALDIDEDPENVQVTIAFLQKRGMIELVDEDTIFIPYVEKAVGSETASTQRSRECRERKKMLQCNTNATQLQQIGNVEKEKEIDIDIYKKKIYKRKSEPKKSFGEYQKVKLTDEELEKLKTEFPDTWQDWITRVDSYCASNGKTYKNYLATIRNWARKDMEDGNRGSNRGYQGTNREKLQPRQRDGADNGLGEALEDW